MSLLMIMEQHLLAVYACLLVNPCNSHAWYFLRMQRGKQKVSKIAVILLILMYLVIVVCAIVALAGPLSWLNYLYVLSYIKLAVTVFKYTPQVC